MTEYLRTWKLLTFTVAVTLMLIGASFQLARDWDIPISLLMCTLTYLTASWSVRVLMSSRVILWPVAVFASWFTVDGVYFLYWNWVNPEVLETMRGPNWPASLPLYFFCGVFWLYRGDITDLAKEWLELMERRSVKPERKPAWVTVSR